MAPSACSRADGAVIALEDTAPKERELHRGIGSRQLGMIAIGGAIGTGCSSRAAARFRRPDREAPCWPTRSWAWRSIA